MAGIKQLLCRPTAVHSRRRPLWLSRHPVTGIESLEDRTLLTDPLLGLTFDRTAPSESFAVLGSTGTVTRTGDLSQAVVVSLVSSDTTEFVVPETVTIAAGQASAMFVGKCVDDTLLDGDQLVTVTATATLTADDGTPFPTSDDFTLTIVDRETVSATVPFSGRDLVYGETTTVTLTRSNTDNEDAITVFLRTDAPTELILPESVVIPAGAASTTFQMSMVDNGVPEGDRTVALQVFADDRYTSPLFYSIELHEAGTRTVDVAVDGTAINTDADAAFESIDDDEISVEAHGNHRGLFEFDTSAYAGRTIEAATLTLRPAATQYFPGDVFHIDIYAYAGDGVLTVTDAVQTGTLVGSFSIDTGVVYNPNDRQSIVLDVAAIQALLNSSSHLGFVAVNTGGGTKFEVIASEWNTGADRHPQLHFFFENHAPTFDQPSYSFAIPENTARSTVVGAASATDSDPEDTIRYSIVAGNTSNAFSINSTTGVITVLNVAALDYETNPQFTLTVQVRDDGRGLLTDQTTVVIDLTDVIAPQVTAVEIGYGDNQWIDATELADRTAPWKITHIRIRFDQAVAVDVNDLTVIGTLGGTYAFSAFAYDSANFIATWTLETPIERDALSINLDGDERFPDRDDNNGDRNEGVNTNGEYLAGGDYDLALDVLYGDVDGDGMVSLRDALIQRSRNGTSDRWADLSGDGTVSLLDALLLRSRNGTTMP